MSTSDTLKEYYARRAPEYENVYLKPERQQDIATLRALLQQLLAGHTLLELACGTGPPRALSDRGQIVDCRLNYYRRVQGRQARAR